MRLAIPSSYDSFIHNTLPAFAGALWAIRGSMFLFVVDGPTIRVNPGAPG